MRPRHRSTFLPLAAAAAARPHGPRWPSRRRARPPAGPRACASRARTPRAQAEAAHAPAPQRPAAPSAGCPLGTSDFSLEVLSLRAPVRRAPRRALPGEDRRPDPRRRYVWGTLKKGAEPAGDRGPAPVVGATARSPRPKVSYSDNLTSPATTRSGGSAGDRADGAHGRPPLEARWSCARRATASCSSTGASAGRRPGPRATLQLPGRPPDRAALVRTDGRIGQRHGAREGHVELRPRREEAPSPPPPPACVPPPPPPPGEPEPQGEAPALGGGTAGWIGNRRRAARSSATGAYGPRPAVQTIQHDSGFTTRNRKGFRSGEGRVRRPAQGGGSCRRRPARRRRRTSPASAAALRACFTMQWGRLRRPARWRRAWASSARDRALVRRARRGGRAPVERPRAGSSALASGGRRRPRGVLGRAERSRPRVRIVAGRLGGEALVAPRGRGRGPNRRSRPRGAVLDPGRRPGRPRARPLGGDGRARPRGRVPRRPRARCSWSTRGPALDAIRAQRHGARCRGRHRGPRAPRRARRARPRGRASLRPRPGRTRPWADVRAGTVAAALESARRFRASFASRRSARPEHARATRPRRSRGSSATTRASTRHRARVSTWPAG